MTPIAPVTRSTVTPAVGQPQACFGGIAAVIDGARLLADALERYSAAMERFELVQRAWEAADCPIAVTHSNGTSGIAPLWRALQEQETHAERLRRPLLRRGHAGPRSFLDVAAEENRIGEDGLSPAARLRLISQPVPRPFKEPASATFRRENGKTAAPLSVRKRGRTAHRRHQ